MRDARARALALVTRNGPWLALLAFFCLLVYPQVLPGSVILRQTDMYAPFLEPRMSCDLFLTAWSPVGGGAQNVPDLFLPFSCLLTAVLGTPLAQRVVAFAPLAVAAVGMYLFLSRTRLVENRWVAAGFGLLYAVNWAVLETTQTSLLTATGYLVTYAAVPFVLLCAYGILLERRRLVLRGMGLGVGLAACLLQNLEAPVQLLPLLLAVFAAFLFLWARESAREGWRPAARRALPPLGALGLAVAVFVLAALPVVAAYARAFAAFGVEEGFAQRHGSKIFIPPNGPWFGRVYEDAASGFTLLVSPSHAGLAGALGLLVPLLALVPLARSRRPAHQKALYLALLVPVAAASWFTAQIVARTPLVDDLFQTPLVQVLLQGFRTPVKPYFVLLPAMTVLAAMGADDLLAWARDAGRRARPAQAAAAGVAAVVVLAGVLSHAGAILHARDYVSPFTSHSTQGGPHEFPDGVVPDYFPVLAARFDAERAATEDEFRVLWLPQESVPYITISYSMDPQSFLFPPRNATALAYVERLVQNATALPPEAFGSALSTLGVKYVVVLHDYAQPAEPAILYSGPDPQAILGSPARWRDLLAAAPEFTLAESTPRFDVFRNDAHPGNVYAVGAGLAAALRPDPFAAQRAALDAGARAPLLLADADVPLGPPAWPRLDLPPGATRAAFGSGTHLQRAVPFDAPPDGNLTALWLRPAGPVGAPPSDVRVEVYAARDGLPEGAPLAGVTVGRAAWTDHGPAGHPPLRVPLAARLAPGAPHVAVLSPAGLTGDDHHAAWAEPGGGDAAWNGRAWAPAGERTLLVAEGGRPAPAVAPAQARVLSSWPDTSPTRYRVALDAPGQAFLVLAQSFDPQWRATMRDADGTEVALTHFGANGWANGWVVPGSGERVVTLTYGWQAGHSALVAAWAVGLAGLAVAAVLLRRRARARPEDTWGDAHAGARERSAEPWP